MAEKENRNVQIATKNEATLIQSIFAGNENLLKVIRSLFFGLDMTEDEKELIRGTFKTEGLLNIFKKRFMPTLTRDAPIGQTLDLWAGVDIRNMNPDAIRQSVYARKRLIEYTEQAMGLLENPDGLAINLQYDPDFDRSDLFQVALIARNSFLNHVETQLGLIKLIAEQPNETLDETKKRLAKDSAK